MTIASTRTCRLLSALFASASLLTLRAGAPSTAEQMSPEAILRELRSFRELGSVLYVAAHPDDENTQLIAYLARGKNYRTAYLSVTRGDGGQNVLGADFDEKLGVARTQELLAARKLDGGKQFFTRAIDFGFSKDYRETLKVWDKDQVVADYVRIIRTFQPDVIITRFSPQPGGTHGHHTASAVLAVEAFKLAADPNAFRDQLGTLKPWRAKRLLQNGRGGSDTDLRMELSGNDPVLGVPLGELAGRSRGMHKTQGFDFRGGGGGARTETFQLLDGEPATNGIMDGIDTTWNRFPGGAEIDKMAEEILAQFKAEDPSASTPAVLKLRAALAKLPSEPVVTEKRAQLDRILQACVGLQVKSSVKEPEYVPGEPLRMSHSAIVRSQVPVRWLGVRYPLTRGGEIKEVQLPVDQTGVRRTFPVLPDNVPLSHPYWLREERTAGMFRVSDLSLIVQPENPSAFPLEHIFKIDDQILTIPDEPFFITGLDPNNLNWRRLDIIPPVTLKPAADVELFKPGGSNVVEIEIVAARAAQRGLLTLDAPPEWSVQPTNHLFELEAIGDRKVFSFTVTAPTNAAVARIVANAQIGRRHYRSQRVEVRYPHLPLQLLHPPASFTALSLDLAIGSRNIGYLPGAGDSIAEHLKEMGCQVKTLDDADLEAGKLKELDAVVLGVRAFNVRTNLQQYTPALSAYAEAGGTVIVQYNRPAGSLTNAMAPYPLRISSERVTDEKAAVEFLAPDHPVLNAPNKITQADFEGWVQERGVYFASQWDEKFTPVLACADANESPQKGSLLIARHGKGYFVYTGLAFFRQLPAGVPGGYRLFANLISLGRPAPKNEDARK